MRGLLIFVLGLVIGGYAMHAWDQQHQGVVPAVTQADDSVRDSIAAKRARWHLTDDDIRADLARSGEVVRAKAKVAGDKIADVRIAAVIKAKYLLDRDLSARDIDVDVEGGTVLLKGRVASRELVGKAVALALDTDGVLTVTSRLVVEPRS